MNIPPCPKSLRAHWIPGDYGELVLSCTRTTAEEVTNDITEQNRLDTSIGVFILIVMFILMLVITKLQNNSATKHKKFSTAYPYSIFRHGRSGSEIHAV